MIMISRSIARYALRYTPFERHVSICVNWRHTWIISAYKGGVCKCDHACIPTMAPVATKENPTSENLKKDSGVFNPFYSPSTGDDGDETYQYARYKVT